jgi:hypothetical protein
MFNFSGNYYSFALGWLGVSNKLHYRACEMKKIKRTKLIIGAARDRVIELLKQGKCTRNIAIELNIPARAVSEFKSDNKVLWQTPEQRKSEVMWNKIRQENDRIILKDGKVTIVKRNHEKSIGNR